MAGTTIKTIGSVPQVLMSQGAYTDITADEVYADINNMSITLTPRNAQSKFKITVVIAARNNGSGAIAWSGAIRNGANTVLQKGRATYSGSAGYDYSTMTLVHIDAPGTASAVTYKASAYRISASGATNVTINQHSSTMTSNIIVEEILG